MTDENENKWFIDAGLKALEKIGDELRKEERKKVEDRIRDIMANIYHSDDKALFEWWLDFELISSFTDDTWKAQHKKGDATTKAILEFTKQNPDYVKKCLEIRNHEKQWSNLTYTFWIAIAGVVLSICSLVISIA